MFYIKRNNDLNLFDEMSNFFGNNILTRGNFMKTDILDNENEYVVTMDIPGVKKENVKIDIEEGYLTVSVSHEEVKEDNSKYIRKERRFESMTRSFYVGDVLMDDIKAKIDNGILNITIPKASPKVEEKKYIEIE